MLRQQRKYRRVSVPVAAHGAQSWVSSTLPPAAQPAPLCAHKTSKPNQQLPSVTAGFIPIPCAAAAVEVRTPPAAITHSGSRTCPGLAGGLHPQAARGGLERRRLCCVLPLPPQELALQQRCPLGLPTAEWKRSARAQADLGMVSSSARPSAGINVSNSYHLAMTLCLRRPWRGHPLAKGK